jgi:plastocyanin
MSLGRRFYSLKMFLVLPFVLLSIPLGFGDSAITKQVNIPDEDRFAPFALTIHIGDSVKWINNDTDDHTVVAVGRFTTTDHRSVDRLILGTDNNGGQPGTLTLTFHQAGRFVYHCRFHSKLNSHGQPVAPGPRGGIQDSKGNFGTPMMGVITVVSD